MITFRKVMFQVKIPSEGQHKPKIERQLVYMFSIKMPKVNHHTPSRE